MSQVGRNLQNIIAVNEPCQMEVEVIADPGEADEFGWIIQI